MMEVMVARLSTLRLKNLVPKVGYVNNSSLYPASQKLLSMAILFFSFK